MARSGANTGKNSKAARSTRKYKRSGTGQFGSGPGTVHKGRGARKAGPGGAAKAHQSKGGASAQKYGSPKNAGQGGEQFSGERARAERGALKRAKIVGGIVGSVAGPPGTAIGYGVGKAVGKRRNASGKSWEKYQAKKSQKQAKVAAKVAKKKRR